MTSAFGPGKVILLGEHAVVYGAQAIAGALERGVTAEARPAARCSLDMPEGLSASVRKQLRCAFDAAADATGRPSVQVRLTSDLPISMGLGSSAALSVAVSRVLMEAAGARPTPRRLGEVAYAMERCFHGTPSGLDHACSLAAGLISYRKAPEKAQGRVSRLSSPVPLQLAVLLVGTRRPARATISALRERKERWPERYARTLREIGRISGEGRRAVLEGDLEGLGDAMNVNHGLLCALGLSSAALDGAVHGLRQAGALGAKLTGAGGDGGAIIGLFDSRRKADNAVAASGLPGFTSTLEDRGRTRREEIES